MRSISWETSVSYIKYLTNPDPSITILRRDLGFSEKPDNTSHHATSILNVKLLRHAEENPKATWRQIKRWFQSANPNKNFTQSQISQILNPKRPRGPSDVDPIQVQKVRPEAKRIKSTNSTRVYSSGSC